MHVQWLTIIMYFNNRFPQASVLSSPLSVSIFISGDVLLTLSLMSTDARSFSTVLVQVTIVAKSPGTLCTFLLCIKLSSPSSPQKMFFVRSTCGSGKISRAQQWLVSHRRNNIVLGGVGVRVLRKDEEVERTMVFHHIFVSVPRTFDDYCGLGLPLFLCTGCRD